jgi:hypothetical protein
MRLNKPYSEAKKIPSVNLKFEKFIDHIFEGNNSIPDSKD